MAKFKPGEKARIRVVKNPLAKALEGQEVVVEGLLHLTTEQCACGSPAHYQLKGTIFVGCEYALEKLLPDSDTYHKSTWQDYERALEKVRERVEPDKEGEVEST